MKCFLFLVQQFVQRKKSMNSFTKPTLIVGILLICWGLFGTKLSDIINISGPSKIDTMELSAPSDPALKKEADDVVNLLKNSSAEKSELKKLRDLMLDLGRLVQLDGEDEIIKNTDEIRQANSIAGIMLRLDVKGKYANLAKESHEVMVAAIGDDNIALSKDLRPKAVDGFNALAWAYNESSK